MATVNQSVIDKAKAEYKAAYDRGDKVGMEKAHAKAEAERAKAGYSGGTDGSQYIKLPTSSSSGGSSSSSSKSSSSSSSSKSGSSSSSSSGTSSVDVAAIIKQMEQNSAAWHTANADQRALLQAENQKLGSQIGGVYNPTTGSWSTSSGTSLYSSAPTTQSTAQKTATGAYTGDYSVRMQNAMANNASWQEIEQLNQERVSKIQSDPNLSQYMYDPTYYAAMDYIKRKQSEESAAKQAEEQQAAILEAQKLAEEQALAAVDFQNQQYINELNAQNQAIEESRQNQAQQAYINNMLENKNLGGALAAQGITGGAVESTLMGLSNQYQNNLNQIETGASKQLNDLQLAVLQAEAQGGYQKAQLQAQLGSQYAQILMQLEQMNYGRQQDSLANQFAQDQWSYNKTQQEQQLAAQQQQQAYDNAFNRWVTTGTVQSAADAKILGVPVGTPTSSYQFDLIAQQKKTSGVGSNSGGSSGGSGGGSSGGSSDTSTLSAFGQNAVSAATGMLQQGVSVTDVVRTIEQYRADGYIDGDEAEAILRILGI